MHPGRSNWRLLAAVAVLSASLSGAYAGCLIISEVVMGAVSGDCPRWIELTNTAASDFTFYEGGIIVQQDGSSDVVVDIDLTGVTIRAGRSFIIASNEFGACAGAFQGIYGFPADFNTAGPLGDGDDRYIVTDTADGSHLLDIYGEFGVDGTGRPWEYTRGYSYRLPNAIAGNGGVFAAGEWFFGGVGSLAAGDPEQLLLNLTTPGRHYFSGTCHPCPGDLDGDSDVDLADLSVLLSNYGTGGGAGYEDGDLDGDGDVDLADLSGLLAVYGTSC